MEFLKKFQQNYKSNIDIFHDYADNFVAIKDIIYTKLGIQLDDYNYDISTRKTNNGYKMKYHRDNYMLRKFKNEYKFIPFDHSNIPTYTLIWYKNSDFTGGTLEFLDKKIIKPCQNMFVFFDSNDIHRVNEQLSGERIIEIYKFYKMS